MPRSACLASLDDPARFWDSVQSLGDLSAKSATSGICLMRSHACAGSSGVTRVNYSSVVALDRSGPSLNVGLRGSPQNLVCNG